MSKIFTSEEVAKAVRSFVESGGLVVKLPEETVPPNKRVGDRYGCYVPIFGDSVQLS